MGKGMGVRLGNRSWQADQYHQFALRGFARSWLATINAIPVPQIKILI
jgi:hypothetical protein